MGPEHLFRGVTSSEHKLVPSIGRGTEAHTHGDILVLEKNLASEFRRLAVSEIKVLPETDFEWPFLAQHYGLPSRLLDWSSNPLIALYFAVERNDEEAGAVYALRLVELHQRLEA